MATGNTFGTIYRMTTYGESHGRSIGVIIDGCPPGLELDLDKIQYELDRRAPGQSKITTGRKEPDKFEIHSGIQQGTTITLGTPIMMLVLNKKADPTTYANLVDVYRRGHADYTTHKKEGIVDVSGGGRASARETIGRVLAGAVADQVLRKFTKIDIFGYTTRVANVAANKVVREYIEQNAARCPDPDVSEEIIKAIASAKSEYETLGGSVEVVAKNVPPGLGEPVFDKLDAVLAHALKSIPATMGFQKGLGVQVETMRGSEYEDRKSWIDGKMIYKTNHGGGIEGGISNGEDIIARVSFKPISTRKYTPMDLPTHDKQNREVTMEGKHDPTAMPRAVAVVEAMTRCVLLDMWLRDRTYEGLRLNH